jgi:hypothetical protein
MAFGYHTYGLRRPRIPSLGKLNWYRIVPLVQCALVHVALVEYACDLSRF